MGNKKNLNDMSISEILRGYQDLSFQSPLPSLRNNKEDVSGIFCKDADIKDLLKADYFFDNILNNKLKTGNKEYITKNITNEIFGKIECPDDSY